MAILWGDGRLRLEYLSMASKFGIDRQMALDSFSEYLTHCRHSLLDEDDPKCNLEMILVVIRREGFCANSLLIQTISSFLNECQLELDSSGVHVSHPEVDARSFFGMRFPQNLT
jgi:adenosine deaminase